MLWFIANCFDEVYGKQRPNADLRDAAAAKSKPVPEMTRYKGAKVVNHERIEAKKVYGFGNKTTDAERSRSPLAKTPLKSRKGQETARTPLGKNRTEVKKGLFSMTPVRMSTTAKK